MGVAWGPGSRRRFWVGLAVFGALAVVAGRQMLLSERAAAERWLARATSAPARYDYHGTQVLRFDWQGEAREAQIRVVHFAPDRTRLEFTGGGLDGLCRISRGGESWTADRQRGEVTQVASLSIAAPSGLPADSLDGYRARVGPGESIAGRVTRRVRVSGGGQERVWWLDRETGIVLRRRDRARGGASSDVAFIEFTLGRAPGRISFDPPTGPPATRSEPLAPSAWPERLGFGLRRPTYLPPGYRLTGTYLYDCQCCAEPAGQATYSDGLATFSLYQIRADQPCCQPAGTACTNQTECLTMASAQGGAAVREIDGLLYLALGTAPREQLIKVVDSLAGPS